MDDKHDVTQKIIAILAANGDIVFRDVDGDEAYKLTEKGQKRAIRVMQRLSAEETILVSIMLKGM